jgi:hypothetical protein
MSWYEYHSVDSNSCLSGGYFFKLCGSKSQINCTSSTFLNKRRKQKADLHPGSTVILFLSFTEQEKEAEADLSPG